MAIAFKYILQKMGHGIFEPVGAPDLSRFWMVDMFTRVPKHTRF